MNNKIIRFFAVLLVAFLLFYFGYQGYSWFNPSFKTKAAVMYTVSDSFYCRGIAVRDESIVRSDAIGIVRYLTKSGEKVASGAVIAELYGSTEAARSALAGQEIDNQIAVYNALDSGSSATTGVVSLTDQLYEHLYDLADLCLTDLAAVNGSSTETVERLYGYYSTTGHEYDFSAYQSELAADRAAIGSLPLPTSTIRTDVSGYLITYSDGFEWITKESILDFTPEMLSDLLSAPLPEKDDSLCRLVQGYEWYFAALVDPGDASRLNVGKQVSLEFVSTTNSVPVTVMRMESDEETGQVMVLFRCDKLNSELADLRISEACISFRNYSGIRVDRNALRLENGVTGVYVKQGTQVIFRELDVIFETDEYLLSNEDSMRPNVLRLYDEIIVEGKDLYVGKELG